MGCKFIIYAFVFDTVKKFSMIEESEKWPKKKKY